MKVRISVAIVAIALSALATVGCGGNPAAPGPPGGVGLTGAWSGTVMESHAGQGRLRLVIEQVQFALTGTFTLEFPDASLNRSGTISGQTGILSLPPAMQLLAPAAFDCGPGQIRESVLQVTWARQRDALTGSYVGFACVGTITGTFDVALEK